MAKEGFFTFKIEERSYVSLAKKEIRKMVLDAGFSAGKAGEIDIIVAELSSNLIKHADNGGELICRISNESEKTKFFEIFSIDRGPGNNDMQKMLRDGISSTNTLGHGLGAITRLSDFSQVFSMRKWGTVVYSQKFAVPPGNYIPKAPICIKSIQESYPGATVCGDGVCVKYLRTETQIFVGDGLGHGIYAHEAVQAAITAFNECGESDPVELLRFIHNKVKRTRGLVGSIAIYNHEQKKWKMAGVGNIATRLYNGLEYKNYAPHNGIIGLNIPSTMKPHEAEAEKFQIIVMASDGIKTKWDLSKYTSILKYDPSILAASVFMDNARKTDDMTLLVGKINM